MKRLLIIDGNAIVHRAFHALPPLTTPDGILVNAVYGFFSMLLKVLEEVKPQFLVVCFDRPAPTFRKQLYAGYQAHRPQTADDLSGQITMLHDALRKSHVVMFGVDGYEADDLIGTLALQAVKHADIEVRIITGDRDLLQLVNGRVRILMPVLGITKMVEYDSEGVKEKFGILPSQIIDYKALVGDQSDGYPGVTGIGPKTASELLQKYTTFENLYTHISDISPKIAEKLAKDAEQAALARKLATIVTDAPITLNLQQCDLSHITKEDLRTVFQTLGFQSILKRLDAIKEIRSQSGNKAGTQMHLL